MKVIIENDLSTHTLLRQEASEDHQLRLFDLRTDALKQNPLELSKMFSAFHGGKNDH